MRVASGECPAEDFLAGLDSQAQTQFKARFEQLTSVGYLRNPDQYRRLEVKGEPMVYEIKAHCGPGWRLYVVQVGKTWIATHGCQKPKDRRVPNEVEKARKIFEEWTP